MAELDALGEFVKTVTSRWGDHPAPHAIDVFQDGRLTEEYGVDRAGFSLSSVHEQRLVGVWRDELGVEFVRVYGLRPLGR